MRRLIAVVLATAVLDSAAQQPTFLAVVDAGGLLTPIAVYDGTQWWNRWPWRAEGREHPTLVPPSLQAIPDDWLPPGLSLPIDWQVLPRSGASISLRVLRPSRAPAHALMNTVVFQTTLPPRRGGPADELVAIAGGGVLGRFVRPSRDEEAAVLRQLAPRIAALEQAELTRWSADREASQPGGLSRLSRLFPVDKPSGRTYVRSRPAGWKEFALTRAATAFDGHTYFYLDGEKLFGIDADDCMVNLSTSGVASVRADGTIASERISTFAFAEYCGDRSESLVLLATLLLENRMLWIVRNALEDGYDYALFDPTTGEQLQLQGSQP